VGLGDQRFEVVAGGVGVDGELDRGRLKPLRTAGPAPQMPAMFI
jgi:hypothetical protein